MKRCPNLRHVFLCDCPEKTCSISNQMNNMTQQGMDKTNESLDRIEARMDDINKVLGEIMDILGIDKTDKSSNQPLTQQSLTQLNGHNNTTNIATGIINETGTVSGGYVTTTTYDVNVKYKNK